MAVLKIPDYGQHCVFLGSTGSGKSVLAEKMLHHVKRFFLFDTQDVFDDFKHAKIVKKPSEALKAIKENVNRIIYKPKQIYMDKNINGFIIQSLAESSSKKNKRERVIYIDEIFHLGFMQSFPKELPIALATCRQRSIGFWISTQRPKLIPTNILSECSYIYCFFLYKGDDIKYLSESVRGEKKDFINLCESMKKDEHRFIYMDCLNGDYNLLPKIKK